MSLTPGTRLGSFEILSAIGAGGMGEVYKARDTRLDRVVAIKVLSPEIASAADLRERFEREARTVASLNHPHICTLHDVGRQDGTDFLVMEYLEGETLEQRLRKGALPLDHALQIGIQIADALAAAHRPGIVHRDLKPGNIMLTKSGAKLLDFGLAKKGAPAVAGSLSMLPTTPPGLTQQGTILGTFQYMAPEQLEGKDVDPRTDIFAFGAVLYEMLTGKKAFEGKSHASLIGAILKDTSQPVSALQPMVPQALDRLTATCLEKDPDSRWQTARDLWRELKWIAEGGTRVGLAPPVAGERPRAETLTRTLLAVATLLVIVMAGPTFLYFRGQPPPSEVRFLVSVPPMPGAANFGVSPDGRWLAFSASTPAKTTALFVRQVGSIDPSELPGTEGAAQLFWSPDSRSIAFLAVGRLRRVDVSGGPPQTIVELRPGNWAGGTWNAEGVILFALSNGLHRVSASGGESVLVNAADPSPQGARYAAPCFLADGRHFLYREWSGAGSNIGVHVGSLDSEERKLLFTLTEQSRITCAGDGYILFQREGALFAQPFDENKLELAGDPIRIVDEVARVAGGNAPFDASANGVLIYRTGGALATSQLAWFDRTGKRAESAAEPGQYTSVDLSPDGKQIAVRWRRQANTPDVWLIEWERSVLTRFTFDPADPALSGDLVWSPDGLRIAFTSRRKGNADVFVKNASGIGGETPLLESSDEEYAEDWSKDGRYLAYSFRPASASVFSLYVLPLFGDRKPFPVVQSPFNLDEPHFSFDGKWLAYDSNESGTWQTYVTSFPSADQRRQISTGGGKQPRWRQDGKELYYLALDGKIMAVDVTADTKIDSGIPRELFDTGLTVSPVTDQYDVTPDGQRFLVMTPVTEATPTPITVVLNWTAGLKKLSRGSYGLWAVGHGPQQPRGRSETKGPGKMSDMFVLGRFVSATRKPVKQPNDPGNSHKAAEEDHRVAQARTRC